MVPCQNGENLGFERVPIYYNGMPLYVRQDSTFATTTVGASRIDSGTQFTEITSTHPEFVNWFENRALEHKDSSFNKKLQKKARKSKRPHWRQ